MSGRTVTEHPTNLCLGGPLDGQRYDAGGRSQFRIAKPPRIRVEQVEVGYLRYPPPAVITTEYVDYVLSWLNTPDGRVSFWVLSGTTPLEAIQLLLAGYRPNAGGNRTP